MKKRITFTILVVLAVLLIFTLIKQINDAVNSGKRLEQTVEEVNKLQDQNRTLKERLEEAESVDYIEEVARNKLNRSYKNETVMVIDPKAIEKVLEVKIEQPPIKIANWQGWMKMFFR